MGVSFLGAVDVYMPCTAPTSACESDEFWFGSQGVCNTTSGICVCPEGYSGHDDWLLFNDCRVNITAQWSMWIVCTAVACMTFCMSSYGFGYLLSHWNIAESQLRRLSSMGKIRRNKSASSLQASPLAKTAYSMRRSTLEDLPSPSEILRRRHRRRQIRKRQRWTFLSLLLFLIWSLGAIIYYSSYLAGHYHYSKVWYQDLGMTMSAGSIFSGLWAFFYIWYQQLPSLRLYGKLFDVDSILIRRPKFVEYTMFARLVVINLSNIMILLVWPYVIDTSVETRTLLDSVFLLFLVVYILDFGAVSLVLAKILYKLFTTLRELSELATERGITTGVEQATFLKALRTIVLIRRVIMVAAPLAATVLLIASLLDTIRTRMYLALNVVVLIGNIVIAFAVFVFIYRLAGEKRSAPSPISPDVEVGSSSAENPAVSHINL